MVKWLKVPVSNETKDVKVAQMWEVRWASVKGHRGLAFGMSDQQADIQWGSAQRVPEVEVFYSEQEANDFAESLRAAMRLIRLTCCTEVTVSKTK